MLQFIKISKILILFFLYGHFELLSKICTYGIKRKKAKIHAIDNFWYYQNKQEQWENVLINIYVYVYVCIYIYICIYVYMYI